MISLHSILVKSIRDDAGYYGSCPELYIPFWLNLYDLLDDDDDVYIYLYIPFWLNLYKGGVFMFLTVTYFTFHSG